MSGKKSTKFSLGKFIQDVDDTIDHHPTTTFALIGIFICVVALSLEPKK